MRNEHYQPSLSDRHSREEWEAKGKKSTWERASEQVKDIIAAHKHSLPEGVRSRVLAEIKGIVE
jgi:trimethylamine:corrinoid methyltransferase-like protein